MKIIDITNMDGRWMGERINHIFSELKDAGSEINANTIVCSAKLANLLEMLIQFKYILSIEGSAAIEIVHNEEVVRVGHITDEFRKIEGVEGVASNVLYTVYARVDKESDIVTMYGPYDTKVEVKVILEK